MAGWVAGSRSVEGIEFAACGLPLCERPGGFFDSPWGSDRMGAWQASEESGE